MLLTIHSQNPDDRQVSLVASFIKAGGIVILPTDSIYALVCDIYNQKAVDRVCRVKNVKLEKSNFSFLCSNLSKISFYTRPFSRNIYKLMNKAFPGPYTFILDASSEVPSIFRSRKKTIGIRIPDHPFVLKVIEAVGNPLMSTSLHNDDEIIEYPTDPNEIYEKFSHEVDCVVDGGFGNHTGSTVIDCTKAEPEIIRTGIGDPTIIS